MRKAAHHLDGVDSLNPCRLRGKQLHHHGAGVCWFFLLLWMDSWCHKLIVCKKWYKNNLKMKLTVLVLAALRCAPHLLGFLSILSLFSVILILVTHLFSKEGCGLSQSSYAETTTMHLFLTLFSKEQVNHPTQEPLPCTSLSRPKIYDITYNKIPSWKLLKWWWLYITCKKYPVMKDTLGSIWDLPGLMPGLFSQECHWHVWDVSENFRTQVDMCVGVDTKSTPTQEFCVGNHQQIVDTVVFTDTVVHTPRVGNTVGILKKSKSSGHVNVFRFVLPLVCWWCCCCCQLLWQ